VVLSGGVNPAGGTMGEKGLSSTVESAPAPADKATTAPVAKKNVVAAVDATFESATGRFEEAARKAQERINQRSEEKTKRAISDHDVKNT
jgi:hypothetical protein